MNLKALFALATILVGLAAIRTSAQDFSADVVYASVGKPMSPHADTPAAPQHASKLYVSKEKMRLETRGLTGTVLLVDDGKQSTVALFPARKAYQPLMSAPSQYFRVADPDNACSDWQRASNQKIACEKVGHETVDGRDTVKYQNKNSSADTSIVTVWIDTNLKFVVKWEGINMAAELHNIKEAQQSADLFTVPASYEILKPMKKAPKAFKSRPR